MQLLRICGLTLLIALAAPSISAEDVNLKQVRCLVCRAMVDEFEHEVNKIDPKKNIEIGQYRLDPHGNMHQKKVPLAMSETHLSDVLETICKKIEDYVRATYKSSGKLTLMKLMSDNGVNPLLNEVDIVQDGDLNKSLEYFCKEVVNEMEDTFIDVMIKKKKNAKAVICSEEANYCEGFGDDADDDQILEDEDEQADKEEL